MPVNQHTHPGEAIEKRLWQLFSSTSLCNWVLASKYPCIFGNSESQVQSWNVYLQPHQVETLWTCVHVAPHWSPHVRPNYAPLICGPDMHSDPPGQTGRRGSSVHPADKETMRQQWTWAQVGSLCEAVCVRQSVWVTVHFMGCAGHMQIGPLSSFSSRVLHCAVVTVNKCHLESVSPPQMATINSTRSHPFNMYLPHPTWSILHASLLWGRGHPSKWTWQWCWSHLAGHSQTAQIGPAEMDTQTTCACRINMYIQHTYSTHTAYTHSVHTYIRTYTLYIRTYVCMYVDTHTCTHSLLWQTYSCQAVSAGPGHGGHQGGLPHSRWPLQQEGLADLQCS